jgi:hypothetical protein
LPIIPLSSPGSRLRSAGGGAPSPEERARIESELTTSLLQALSREVRDTGARFLLLMVPRHWPRVDLRALRADGIQIDFVSIPLEAHRLRFKNDGHLNAMGHRLYAEGLAPILHGAMRPSEPR